MNQVLGCLINWRRPLNVAKILRAMRDQSTRIDKLVLLECAPGTEFQASPQAHAIADVVITINENIGPISRLFAPLAFPQFKYTYFGVDDHIPGHRHVEYLLRCAKSLNDNFATIGMDGRNIRGGEIVKRKGRMQDGAPTPVDVITTSELMLSKWVPRVMEWRHEFLNGCGGDVSFLEDDLFICFGAQHHSGRPSYLTAAPPAPEFNWTVSKLHAPHALCGRPDHYEVRNHFVRRAQEFGWYSRSEQLENASNG